MSKKMLIFGATGLLGTEFARFYSNSYKIVGLSSEHADIADPKQVNEVISNFSPDIVVNCAAIANVDLCEENRELAYAVNVTGAENIAVACQANDILFIHISTDYLFDGLASKPYCETDKINPINYYGMTKMLAEKIINDVSGKHIILRVAWLYSLNEKSFLYKIIHEGVTFLVKKGHGEDYSPVKVVSDQFGTPTSAYDVAAQTEKIIDSGITGTFHCTAEGEVSRFEMAKMIFEHLTMPVEIIPVKSDQFDWKAPRPKYTVLKNEALKEAGINIMPPYDESLKKFIDNMATV